MRFSTRQVVLLAVCLCATALVGVFLLRKGNAASPRDLFQEKVVRPIPESVNILESDYIRGREWRVILHFQLSPRDHELLVAAKSYKRIAPGSNQYDSFLQTTYRLFKRWLPSESVMADYEVYEVFDDSSGTINYLVSNHSHTEAFAIAVRF